MALTEAPTNKKRPSPTSAANMGPGEPPAKKPAAPRAIISACAPKKSITSLNAQALANAVASTRALPGVARQAKHFEKNGALLTSTHQVWAEFEVEELQKGASTLTKQSTKSFDEDPAPFGAPGSTPGRFPKSTQQRHSGSFAGFTLKKITAMDIGGAIKPTKEPCPLPGCKGRCNKSYHPSPCLFVHQSWVLIQIFLHV